MTLPDLRKVQVRRKRTSDGNAKPPSPLRELRHLIRLEGDSDQATYTWELNGNSLTLTGVDDECAPDWRGSSSPSAEADS